MKTGDPRGNPQGARRQATVLESVEEVRAQVRRAAATTEAAMVVRPGADGGEEAQPFRPTARPPMALLYVLDDGDDGGEVVRIRAGSFVIGRLEGDLVIPHDGGMSGRHLEISRRLENAEYRWMLTDLRSTNGTFVRAANVILGHEQELLIGGRRLRFELQQPAGAGAGGPSGPAANATQKWQSPSHADVAGAADAALVEVPQAGEGRRFRLTGAEQWLGRDPHQSAIVVDDPMVDRRHARIYRDEKGRWILAGSRTVNGLWARVQEVALGRGGYFQAGEQRFLLKVL